MEPQDITNVINLYEPLAKTYEASEFNNNSEAVGFLKCMYLVKRVLKNFKHLNMHRLVFKLESENRNFLIDNSNQKRHILSLEQKIIKLSKSNKDLRQELQQAKSKV